MDETQSLKERAVQKVRHSLGETGLDKQVTKFDEEGRGLVKRVMFLESLSDMNVFVQFLFYSTCLYENKVKYCDQIIASERSSFIDFRDQNLSLFGE